MYLSPPGSRLIRPCLNLTAREVSQSAEFVDGNPVANTGRSHLYFGKHIMKMTLFASATENKLEVCRLVAEA